MSAATADADGNYLSTPTLDAESSDLLQTIASHGGYAYVRMSTLAASGDFRAAETAREMAWEQLHSGPWHSVLPAWRDAYSMACLHVAKFHYRNGEFKEALRVLDLGLIMGGVLLKKDLESAVETVTAKSREKESEGFEKGPKYKFVEEGVAFDKEEVVRVLPEKSLSSKIVVKKSGLSLEGFLREHFLSGSPVIISDCMAHWPARTKWNDMDYLKRVAGDRTVPVEVVGKKYVRLYASSISEELYPYNETMLCNSSQVNLDNIDDGQFPKVHDLEFLDCILEEGEMLYIPPKWWHYVRSLTISFSVSFWWSDSESSDAS